MFTASSQRIKLSMTGERLVAGVSSQIPKKYEQSNMRWTDFFETDKWRDCSWVLYQFYILPNSVFALFVANVDALKTDNDLICLLSFPHLKLLISACEQPWKPIPALHSEHVQSV